MSNTWSEKYTYTSYREGKKKKGGGSLLWRGLGVSREGLSKEVVFKAEAEWGGGLTRQGCEGCNKGMSSNGKVWTADPAKPKVLSGFSFSPSCCSSYQGHLSCPDSNRHLRAPGTVLRPLHTFISQQPWETATVVPTL